ncbi:MAG: hypothetical protein E7108_00540 [Bacteroidales bacterium]|nr:hypothetical protein [Bacteroidales bacterium]
MKKVLTKTVLVSMMVLGLVLVSCNSKPKEQPAQQPAATDPDAALVSAAENKLKAHQEDIQTLWDLSYGEDKKISNYYLAGDYVLISTEDGKEEYLLYFFKDIKDIENFDGIPVCEGQEVSFQGNAVIVKGLDRTTYFEKTEDEGFQLLFTVTEKDGKKVYTDDCDKPYDEKAAQAFIDKISGEPVTKLSDILKKWK